MKRKLRIAVYAAEASSAITVFRQSTLTLAITKFHKISPITKQKCKCILRNKIRRRRENND